MHRVRLSLAISLGLSKAQDKQSHPSKPTAPVPAEVACGHMRAWE